MCAFDIVTSETTIPDTNRAPRFVSKVLTHGLLVMTANGFSIRSLTLLAISEEDYATGTGTPGIYHFLCCPEVVDNF